MASRLPLASGLALMLVLLAAVLLSSPASALRVSSMFLDEGASVAPIFAASTDAAVRNATAQFVFDFDRSKPDVRMDLHAEIVSLTNPDVIGFQNGVSVFRQSPATVFAATQLKDSNSDTVALFMRQLAAFGLEYTIVSESLDLDVTSFLTGRELDITDKLRIKIRSGIMVRTSLLTSIVTRSQGKFQAQLGRTTNEWRTPVFEGLGYQRIKFFVDSTPWVLTHVALADAAVNSAINRAQGTEVRTLVAGDEFSIVFGALNAEDTPLQTNSYSVLALDGFLDGAREFRRENNTAVQDIYNLNTTTTTRRTDYVLFRTPPVYFPTFQTLIYQTWYIQQRGIWPSSHFSVFARILPRGSAAEPAPAVPLAYPTPPPPAPTRRQSFSSTIEEALVDYTRIEVENEAPTTPGAFISANAPIRNPDPALPIATTTSDQAYEPNAFINRVRPLTTVAAAGASAVAVSNVVTLLALVIVAALLF